MANKLLSQSLCMARFGLRARLRGSALGLFWVMIPAVTAIVIQGKIFQHALRLTPDHYLLFLAFGFIPWMFLSQSLDMTVGALLIRSQLFRTSKIRYATVILAQIFENSVGLGTLLSIFVLYVLFQKHESALDWFRHLGMIGIALAVLFIVTYQLCALVSLMQVFLRDTRFLLTFGMGLSLFCLPIFYETSSIPTALTWVQKVHPAYLVIEPIRLAGLNQPEFFTGAILRGAIVAILSTTICQWLYRRLDYAIRLSL